MHRVTVDGFLIDRTPVTNRQFKEFVRATGYVTLAEISPDPTHYTGRGKGVSAKIRHPAPSIRARSKSNWSKCVEDGNGHCPPGSGHLLAAGPTNSSNGA